MRIITNPNCFKCGAKSSSFLVWRHPIGEATFILLYCRECGAVQGVVRKGHGHGHIA